MSLHMPRLITWQYSSAREELEHALADVRRGIGYAHTRRLERGDLVLRAALAARRDHTRTIGADEARVVRFQRRLHLQHVHHRYALGDADDCRDARVRCLQY